MKKDFWFDLKDQVVVITGGAGLLGKEHAKAIIKCEGIPIIADLNLDNAHKVAQEIGGKAEAFKLDVTNEESINELLNSLLKKYSRIDALINNAALDPKVGDKGIADSRFESVNLEFLQNDLNVNLLGAVLCSKVFGSYFANNGGGKILNISSELGIIAPDQRLYKQKGVEEDQQPVKPVSYSIAKAGLIGLTKYLATYWPEKGVRANAICPGGVEFQQPENFKQEISKRIPLGRMAQADEYQALVAFLCSDASSYMTGAVISADGGRTVW
jgi:NAD(P)-dependent dehydrogenase (short-subunit alcohol dehydrogenase family)